MPILNKKVFSLSANTGESSDPVRNKIDSYWIYDGSQLTYDNKNRYVSESRSAFTLYLNFEFGVNYDLMDTDPDTGLISKTYIDHLQIEPRYPSEAAAVGKKQTQQKIQIDPEKQFDSYIEEQIIPSIDATRNEYKLDLGSPMEYASDVDNQSVIAGTVNFVYNYGLGSYENKIQDGGTPESSLQNFYKIFPIPSERPITKQRVIKRINGPFLNDFSRTDKVGFLSIQDFFMNSEGFLQTLDVQSRKDSFPFYNEVYFSLPADANKNDKFREELEESGLLMAFCDLMNREDFKVSRGEDSDVVRSVPFENSYLLSTYKDAEQTTFEAFPDLQGLNLNLYDLPEMLKIMYSVINLPSLAIEGSEEPPEPIVYEPLRLKGFLTDSEQADYRLDRISKIEELTTTIIDYKASLDGIVGQINDLVLNSDNYKSYTKILEGDNTTYQSNVLFFRVKKFEEGSGTPIQNFWIPAQKGYRGIRYIDTQVKYGKMYRYEVCAFKFIIGTEQEFSQKKTGVIDFDQDLTKYKEETSKTIDQLKDLSAIRKQVEESLASNPIGSILSANSNDVIYGQMADYINKNNIDIGMLNNTSLIADDAAVIAGFINNLFDNGEAEYRGQKISLDNLTEEEKNDLTRLQSAWTCLTNNWVLLQGPTEKSTLLELERSMKNAEVISEIRKIIDREREDKLIEDLNGDQLDAIRRQILQIRTIPRIKGFSFDENLNPGDSGLGLDGYAYYSFLNQDIAKTFNLEEEELISILPISTEASKSFYSTRQGLLDRDKFELNDFYYEYFRSEMSSIESIINEYLACYDVFLELGASTDITLDYKRINQYNLVVETNPSIKFVELPYYSSEGMILDNPPIYPNVNVVTYRGVADRLSFFMNSGQGQIEVDPVTFSESEIQFYQDYRKSKKLNDFQPILYKSDEIENLGTTFEIRRLSVPPTGYESFVDARVNTVSQSLTDGRILPAATFDDQLESNTKYYYIFRVADRRGIFSYPSNIMEIEIVENSGIIYPLIRPYEFQKEKTDTTKNLKRLLNVVPRITQVFPPENTSSFDGIPSGDTGVLGRESESLFGKSFKLRLTSKKTGKVVDLNLEFKANVVETAEAE